MQRSLDTLQSTVFDLLVIGGGILGASAARDAALRGLRVAVVERGDWGGGTSSNSLRIIHGGLRYLQRLDLRRMRESIRERSMWLRIAPHLVEPLPVLVPTYGWGLRGKSALRAALAVNDVIAWDRNRALAPDRRLPAGRAVSRADCLALVPELEGPGLTGGVLFSDAQMYSSERLVLETVMGAVEAGAEAANYLEVTGPLRRGGRLEGVVARDRSDEGTSLEIRARVIVNAAGPGAPSLAAGLLGMPAAGPPIGYTLAFNIGVEATGHRVAFAITGRAGDPNALLRRGPRQLFVVPWRGRTLIGTAHLPYDGDPAAFDPAGVDLEGFLAEVSAAWPGPDWSPEDLRLLHAGLLPGRTEGGEAARVVRLDTRHRLVDHTADGTPSLLTVASIKFTTARRVAEETVDRVCAKLGRAAPCVTADTPLRGAPDGSVEGLLAAARRSHDGVAPPVLEHLIRTYGRHYEEVLRVASAGAGPEWLEPLYPGGCVVFAQFIHAVRAEMALTTADIVERRTELGAVGSDSPALRARAAEALAGVPPRGRPITPDAPRRT
ncbi:MAG TPA: glycerol-3-phosphate dehydrogenase/oxidase [Gemmatimonadales bacterium]|jgi:glycerol-3-phosphate dehydrogenase|nr:glycerol-3-phosphate dehydrogenase/oxidase [Gemmatimonadales bacterium]